MGHLATPDGNALDIETSSSEKTGNSIQDTGSIFN
jgi:hypothetical protein